jgi:anti-sigma-K factor RskA
MSAHEQFAEDLALHAVGSLATEECAALAKHLEECASCRRELERLRGGAALLALSASGPQPPARARARLVEALGKESQPKRETIRPYLRPWVGWAAAVLALLVAALLGNENRRLKTNLDEWAIVLERQRAELVRARQIADTLVAPDARHVSVVPVGMKAPPPEGKAIYSEEHKGLVFVASNLSPVPPRKAYELWLIPMKGAPIPAGMFKPDAHGAAMVLEPPLPAGVEAKAFAVTIEPEQGSTTPTLPILMMGSAI